MRTALIEIPDAHASDRPWAAKFTYTSATPIAADTAASLAGGHEAHEGRDGHAEGRGSRALRPSRARDAQVSRPYRRTRRRWTLRRRSPSRSAGNNQRRSSHSVQEETDPAPDEDATRKERPGDVPRGAHAVQPSPRPPAMGSRSIAAARARRQRSHVAFPQVEGHFVPACECVHEPVPGRRAGRGSRERTQERRAAVARSRCRPRTAVRHRTAGSPSRPPGEQTDPRRPEHPDRERLDRARRSS